MKRLLVALTGICFTIAAFGQEMPPSSSRSRSGSLSQRRSETGAPTSPTAAPGQAAVAGAAAQAVIPIDEKLVETSHQANIGGARIKYKVTTGMMPLKSEAGETEAGVFFMAYTLDPPAPAAQRPLLFSFDGGPGSSSVWLHLGGVGPKRVKMLDDGGMPAPPFQLVDNEFSWLDLADVVFIDPVGTGYSRAHKPDQGRKYWSLQGDIDSVGEFIRLYLSRFERWTSPLFLVGESYGTTRAAGLSGYLIEKGISFNGIILVSSILNFQTTRFAKGNDLPYILYLPTYTATAWYHKKLPSDLQKDLNTTLREVEQWAMGGYSEALTKGDRLTPKERQAVIEKLARYTGLDKRFIDNVDLRVDSTRFYKELLRDQKRTVGRLDSRFKGIDALAASERPDFDPSMAAIRPPFTAAFNQYVRTDLGYKNDLTYHILGGGIGPWDMGTEQGYADTSEALRSAFAKNPYMRLLVCSGHYDFATPYFATEYTLSHMGLDPALRKNVRTAEFETGHMVYIDIKALAKLKKEVASFFEEALLKR